MIIPLHENRGTAIIEQPLVLLQAGRASSGSSAEINERNEDGVKEQIWLEPFSYIHLQKRRTDRLHLALCQSAFTISTIGSYPS